MKGYRGKPIRIQGGASTVTCGVDADGIWVSLETEGKPAEVARMPRWTGGVGGMELIASPDERYVTLLIYSGQSSQGYELFAVEPTLTRIGGVAEAHGEGTAPVFAPSSQWVGMLLRCEAFVRDSGEYFETVQDEHADDRVIVDWARLCLHRLPEAQLYTVEVGVEIPRSTDLDLVNEWNTYHAVRFVGDEVVLKMPWGAQLSAALPPAGPITARSYKA